MKNKLSTSVFSTVLAVALSEMPALAQQSLLYRSATPGSISSTLDQWHEQSWRGVAQQQKSKKPLAKTTALASRLIASAFYRPDAGAVYILQDSTRLYYTGSRGGDLSGAKYDRLIKFRYNSARSKLEDWRQISQTFNPVNDIVANEVQEKSSDLPAYENIERTFYDYTGTGKRFVDSLQYWSSGAWNDNTVKRSEYDATGNLLRQTNYKWSKSARTLFSTESFTYSASGKLESRSITFHDGTKPDQLRTKYTYDGFGRLREELLQKKISVWQDLTLKLYTYDVAYNPIAVEQYTMDPVTSKWEQSSIDSSVFDGTGNKLQVIELIWNKTSSLYERTAQSLYAYNTHKQLVMEKNYVWDGAANDWTVTPEKNFAAFYYYEEYIPTGLSEGKLSQNDLVKIFPIPAKNELFIEINSADQNFSAIILDMQGRRVAEQNTGKSQIINVAHMQAGNYTITINGDNGFHATKVFCIQR